MKQHKAEMEAMTKVQVDQTNENFDMILQLEKENQLLRQEQNIPLQQQQQQQLPNSFLPHTSATSQLCNNAEVPHENMSKKFKKQKTNSIFRLQIKPHLKMCQQVNKTRMNLYNVLM
jgi:hypothetical protein